MSDLKLFSLDGTDACEVQGSSFASERSLQNLIEGNLETFLGVQFLATEFCTGSEHRGRIDTLGIDENACPVIIEYKRSSNSNVINQGLFYLDWLVKHRGDFEMLLLNSQGEDAANNVEWSAPRLVCIAGAFSRYDEHAIKQMNRNIELIRYVKFKDDLLLLEQVNAASAPLVGATQSSDAGATSSNGSNDRITVSQSLANADDQLTSLFDTVREHLEGLGDDVQFKELRTYFAFKRIKNFACVEVRTNERRLIVHVKIDPDTIELEEGFTRDMRNIGHAGTGNLEITICSLEDLEKAEELFKRSYENA